jgi:putative acetyltransferase
VIVVRPEEPEEVGAISEVHRLAFTDPEKPALEPAEVELVLALRRSDAWLPDLSLVAVVDGRLRGHVVSTRAWIGDSPVLALGPIGVEPAYQARAIGSALMHRTIEIAESAMERLIGLVGEPAYYARFGFVPAADLGISAPDPRWQEYFQVRRLGRYPPIAGEFEYPAPFYDL